MIEADPSEAVRGPELLEREWRRPCCVVWPWAARTKRPRVCSEFEGIAAVVVGPGCAQGAHIAPFNAMRVCVCFAELVGHRAGDVSSRLASC